MTTNSADDETLDDFVRNLDLTPREVGKLDRDGLSQMLPVCAEIVGIPDEIDPQLPPGLLIAAIVDAEDGFVGQGNPDVESRQLHDAIDVYSGVAATRSRREGPASAGALAALGRLADLHIAAGNLERAHQIYADMQLRFSKTAPRDIDQASAALDQLRGRVRDSADRVTSFRDWINHKRRINPHTLGAVHELYSEAVDNPAAARVRVVDGISLAAPLPVSQIVEAALDAGLQAWAVPLLRGNRWRQRLADLVILRSTLQDATAAQHRDHILNEPYGTSGSTLRDAVFAAGGIPEVSQVLLDEIAVRHQLAPGDVVIHCPYYLRNHPDRDQRSLDEEVPSDPDQPDVHDQLSGVVVTSLGWGGAASVGAQLARWWGWGFTAAAQANLVGLHDAYSFGDWSDEPLDNLRHGDLARRLVAESRTLLDALRSLTQRVVALDHAVGALQALDQLEDPIDSPLALVMIRMQPRRIRFVAKHMLSGGGRTLVTQDQVDALAAELEVVQDELTAAVERHQPACPVVVIDLRDHLEDGYAESVDPVDPVDPDFDSFYATAIDVSDQLMTELAQASRTHPVHG